MDTPPRPTAFGSVATVDTPYTPTETVIKDKPKKLVTVIDELNRSITIKFLSPLDRMRLAKILGGDAKNEVYMGYAALAFAVTKIDEEDVSSNTIREIEFLVERLGDEGLTAVGTCYEEKFSQFIKGADVNTAKN